MPYSNLMTLVSDYIVKTPGLAVTNPATGAQIAVVRSFMPSEVEPLIAAAASAQRDWAAQTAKMRATILKRWFDLLMTQQDALAALCTAECGKPLAESLGEVAYAASFIEWFAEEGKRAYGETIPTFAAGKRVITIKQPVGVCAAITPWNFPLAMITRKAGPALAAGCAMVVKPAEATPLCALALEALAHAAGVPKDVFRVVPTTDPVALGKLFCESPIIRKLSFTGSTPVGKVLIAQSAGTVKRLSMELGGNAPFIVFDDADLDAAIDGVMIAKFRNAGQTCVCANRILVQESAYDAFVAKLIARTRALKVGNGADPAVAIGPLINHQAITKVATLVESATAQGAKIATGGGANGPFFAPTVLTGVTHDMTIANAEIFGPVACVIRFNTEAEAIQIANETPFGLAAYFYARDVGRIWRVMEALEYGMVGINEGAISTEVAPFGGIKESGVGREGSNYGLDEYLELKYALIGGLST